MDTTFLDSTQVEKKANALLSNYTTFKLGGSCPCLIDCRTPGQMEFTIKNLAAQNIDYIVIGGGSNLLVSDKGVSCVVVRYFSKTALIEREGNDVIVSGSTILDELPKFAVSQGLEGINYASGIPGTVGGAIVGNAGAFGKQIGDVLVSGELLSRDGVKRAVGVDSLGFTYRHSKLKESGDIVLSARLRLIPSDKNKLQVERDEILKVRHEKHPNLETHPCAGSFFRNVEPTSKAERRQAAGWFLEQCGAKDFRVGGAAIFEKHANIIVKTDGCRPQDVFELSLKMAQAVKEKFNLTLVREVRLVGDFKGKPKDLKDIIW